MNVNVSKKIWRRMFALLCALVLCVPTTIPVSAANSKAKKITLTIPTSLTIYDEDGWKMNIMDGLQMTSNYDFKFTSAGETNKLELGAPDESGTGFQDLIDTNSVFVIYLKTEAKPKVTGRSKGLNATVEKTTIEDAESAEEIGVYSVSLQVARTAAKDVSATIEAGVVEYNVTYPSNSANYFIDEKGGTTESVESGKELTFVVELDEAPAAREDLQIFANGRRIEDKTGQEAASGNRVEYKQELRQYTVHYTVTANVTFTVMEVPKEFKVDISELAKLPGYDFSSADDNESVRYGGSYTFSLVPEAGYKAPTEFSVTKGEGLTNPATEYKVSSLGGDQYRVTNIREDIKLTATKGTDIQKVTVRVNRGTGYKLSETDGSYEDVALSVNVNYGEKAEFYVELQDGYTQSVPHATLTTGEVIDGAKQGDESKYKFEIPDVTSAVVVTITGVTKNTYTVTLKDGDGYSMQVDNTATVTDGGSYTFTFTIAGGYKISEGGLKVDITDKKSPMTQTQVTPTLIGGSQYRATITEIKSDIEVTISGLEVFEPSVKVEKGDHVKIKHGDGFGSTLDDTTSVKYGEDFTFKVEMAQGYQLGALTATPIAASYNEANGEYTIRNITSDVTIHVSERAMQYTITFKDDKYSNGQTLTYTVGSDVPSLPNAISQEMDLYRFDGWYDEKGIKLDDLNNLETKYGSETSVTLTAKWEPIFKEGWSVTDQGAEEKKGQDQTIVTFKSLAKYVDEVIAGDYNGRVKITGSGTLYSKDQINFDDSLSKEIIARPRSAGDSFQTSWDGTGETGLRATAYRQMLKGDTIENYYTNFAGYTPEEINGWTFSLQKTFKNPANKTRHTIGWIELSVDGDKVIVYSADTSYTLKGSGI